MDARITARARVTAIPTVLLSAAVASVPGALRGAAAQATPEAATAAVPAAWADLGLPEIALQFTSAEVSGMPESVEAGRYLLTITGEPTEEEFAFGPLFLRIPDAMTLDELMAAASEAVDAPPDFFYETIVAGGPTIVASTGATSAVGIIDLVPGEWIVAGGALAQPPVPFSVTGELPVELPEPESTATLTMGEYVIDVTAGELAAGENLVRIENIGAQPHFVEIAKVPDGTTLENIEATIQGFMGATPAADVIAEEDFIPFAISSDQSTGTVMWMPLQLEPGTYSATCWIPDLESMVPHAFMGMYNVFTVA